MRDSASDLTSERRGRQKRPSESIHIAQMLLGGGISCRDTHLRKAEYFCRCFPQSLNNLLLPLSSLLLIIMLLRRGNKKTSI